MSGPEEIATIEVDQPEQKGVWLAIQTTRSMIEVDGKNAFITDENGNFKYGPDEKNWRYLRPDDVPEWVKSPDAIADMMNGVRISREPEEDGRWYRGVICSPPAGEKIH